MNFSKIPLRGSVATRVEQAERIANRLVRSYDGGLQHLRLGGRVAPYDDDAYEFLGGTGDSMRRKHYDKGLRLLWKAEERAPYLSFKDCSEVERQMAEMATRAMTEEESEARQRLSLPEYQSLLKREYTIAERQAIVNILSAIGHGEAYAWFVSSQLVNEVKGTGARSALTMQVFEEAKHFVVLRELLMAFDVPIRRQSAWEYILLERVAAAKGLEKFFGMNILVESIALGFFGLMSELPGLEILRLFHLDEARHTALPTNYLKEFPMSSWQQRNPLAKLRRMQMLLPALALLPTLEPDMAELGIDAFEFGGSVIRKVSALAERNGFLLPVPRERLFSILDALFNSYCSRTRPSFEKARFFECETTQGRTQLDAERSIFGASAVLA